ncbi:WS/DGAT domain-containing protein [Embleya sp. NPDC127516]|uniref:WS/DGAT domain-containing protein n=1 Tax=Embleya sp. NPDC127516 TaxID=3363990 RepID=UPI00381DC728
MPRTPPRTTHPAPGDLPFVVHEWFGNSGDPWFFALVRLRGAAPKVRDLRELVRDRWGSVPRLRLRAGAVVPGRRRGRPRWFVSEDFEPDRYVVAAPVVPGPNALRERVGQLLAEGIPPTRATWRMYLLSGHEHDGFAVLLRMHHAVADGVTVIRLLERLMGAGPGTDAAAEPAGPGPAVRRVPPSRASARGLAATAGGVLRRNSRLPFNGRIGAGRHVTWVTVSPETVRAARRATRGGGRPTVNDVYLAAVAGALRAVAPAGPALPRRVAALVPVNLRATGEAARIGNVVSFFRVPLPLAERDPGVRLARVHAATTRAKATGQAAIARAAIEVSARLPLRVGWFAGLVTMSAGYANTSCTNIPGPDAPLILLGRPAIELVVAPPLMGAQGVVFGFTGLGDAFTVCVTADRTHGVTADRLAEAIRVEFEELAQTAAR